MTATPIADLFARFREAMARKDSTALAALYDPNCVVDSPMFGRLTGRASIDQVFRQWFSSFPDAVEVDGDPLITGDRVAVTLTIDGTDTGGLLGQAPTRKRFRIFAVRLCDVAGGLIVHERRVYDVNGLMLQLATGRDVPGDAIDLYRTTLARVRLEHEVAMAAEIQRALLPSPHHNGAEFEVAAACSPCRAIAGDFVDYFELPDRGFSFALGDVSGKGPPAALLAAKLQGILAAYAKSARPPAAILTEVNDELVRRTVESRFATMIYGVLCNGHLTYSCAGHNPAMIVSAGGVRRLGRGGLILGMFEDATFEEETVQLAPGDVLVAYTDGVTEAQNHDGAEFGEERLLAAVAEHWNCSPAILLEHVLAAIREFSEGREPADDVTALVLRYVGS